MLAFKLLFTKLENRNVRKVIPLEGQRHKTNIYIYTGLRNMLLKTDFFIKGCRIKMRKVLYHRIKCRKKERGKLAAHLSRKFTIISSFLNSKNSPLLLIDVHSVITEVFFFF